MSSLVRVIWCLFGVWAAFLLIVLITSQLEGTSQFGSDNLRRLEPGARQMGNAVCDLAEMIGLDFSSIRDYYNNLTVYSSGYTPFGDAFVIVITWAASSWVFAAILTKLLSFGDRGFVSTPSLRGGDVVSQRILAIVIVIFLVILFSPGWPAEGPVFRWLNDAMAEPSRDRQSAAIVAELDRQAQDWLPAELSPACRDVLTDGPAQESARSDPNKLRTCGESVKSALEADATMGREPDPRTESASIRFLLEISGLAKNGQLEGVGVADIQFRSFERFARSTYPDLRQEGWRQAAQRYLGLLQFPDEREDSQDARADTGYKLSVLAELLYNSEDAASHDVAYRIAAVTGSELSCVPDALRNATNDDGTPVAVPDLPSCLSIVSAARTSDTSWIGLGSTPTKAFIGFLILVGMAIPFVPWPANFPYAVLYLPLSVLLVLSALG